MESRATVPYQKQNLVGNLDELTYNITYLKKGLLSMREKLISKLMQSQYHCSSISTISLLLSNTLFLVATPSIARYHDII
jgi:hypothetical protein